VKQSPKLRTTWVGGIEFTIEPLEVISEHLVAASNGNSRVTVITPNISHFIPFYRDPRYRQALSSAHILVPDGWPMAAICCLFSRSIVKRVPGSTLMLKLISLAERDSVDIALLGGRGNSAKIAAQALQTSFPRLNVSLCDPMPPEMFDDSQKMNNLLNLIEKIQPKIVFVGLGNPKQEVFSNEYLRQELGGVILNIGAGIDFISGVQTRAPIVIQRIGLEWAFRIYKEPMRLLGRYPIGAFYFLKFLTFECFWKLIHSSMAGYNFNNINHKE